MRKQKGLQRKVLSPLIRIILMFCSLSPDLLVLIDFFLSRLQISTNRAGLAIGLILTKQVGDLIFCLAHSGIIVAAAISIFHLGNSPLFFLRTEGEAGCFQFIRVKLSGTGLQIAKLIQRLVSSALYLASAASAF